MGAARTSRPGLNPTVNVAAVPTDTLFRFGAVEPP